MIPEQNTTYYKIYNKLRRSYGFYNKTRDAFPAAKIRKERFRKVLNIRTKSCFSNFEVGWRTFPWSRKCLSVVLKYMQVISGFVNTKKSCVSWKMFEMEFKFSKLVKSIVFRCLYKVKRHLSKNMKKISA